MDKFKLEEYIERLKEYNQIVELYNCENVSNVVVEKVIYNSKEAIKKSLFVCKGFGDNFKEEYLNSAINNGSFVYISTKKYNVDTPCIIVKDAFIALCIISDMYYNFPDNKLNLIGITGTKGKSTTSYYIKYILDEYAKEFNKKDTAIISSIDTYDGVEKFESHLTTPESLDIFKHFNNSVQSGIENLVMEVSSQALKVGRVYTLNYDIGVFLNISEDHISPIEHPDFEDYFSSKLKLFEKSNCACVNMDSDYSDRILEKAICDSKEVITFSAKNENADVYAYNIHKDGFNTVFNVRTSDFDREFVLTMPGLFNVENALAAISVAVKMGIPESYIYLGLKKARSSGRMEVYHTKDERIIVLVDYAHNKLSFEKLYESTKNEYKDRKIITIFGCPGKKAYIRRRDLGLLAGKHSNKVYLVAEDPGYEPVKDISNEIATYVKQNLDNYEMIEDRGEAIKEAINYADNNYEKTIILVTGKGNETRQKYGSEYLPCKSDVEYAKMYLNEYDKLRMGDN